MSLNITPQVVSLAKSGSTPLNGAITLSEGANITLTQSGQDISIAGNAGTVTSVSGTTNRITSSGGATPVIDIAATYVGQTSITTLGTITTGIWTGTTIAVANGGTGVTSSTGTGSVVLSDSPALTTSPTAPTQAIGDNSTKIATTAFVTSAFSAQNYKEAVKVATTATLVGTYSNGTSGVGATFTYTALGADVIDGVTLALNDRVLLKNQTSDLQNGIYKVTIAGAVGVAGVLTRATDFDQSNEINTGDAVFVTSGTTLSSTTWAYTGIDAPTMGTTSITFTQIAGQGSLTAGSGITITGTSIALTTPVTVALGGTNATTASITSFNNITGYTASGATGTTSTNLVFSTSPTITTPTFVTNITDPLVIGGTGTTSTLTLRSTSGVGAAGADIIFQTGNNGATEVMRMLNSGNVGIGTASPGGKLEVYTTAAGRSINFNTATGNYAWHAFQVNSVDKGYLQWNINDAATAVGTAMILNNTQGKLHLWDSTNSGIQITGGLSLFQVPCVRAYNSANQNVSNVTFTALALDSETYDTDTIHDNATNNSRLTCKTAGKYRITGHLFWAANATGLRDLSIRLNGTTYIAEVNQTPVSGTETAQNVTTTYNLAVNDYVELIGYQSSGGVLVVERVNDTSPTFMMERVST